MWLKKVSYMIKKILSVCLGIFLVSGLATGCKPSRHATRHNSSDYFQTDFQDESQFIVEAIVSDLAEQIYYAKFHRLPEAENFSISAEETADSQFSTPTYELQIDLDAGHQGLKTKLNINGPIWSPEVYDPVAALLANSIGLTSNATESPGDTVLLAKLTDGQAATIEAENQKLSQALESDFSNPLLHEQAAVLLGAFTLREHSGNFFEIRSPLCRLTAQLALARYLAGGDLNDVNGRMADAMLLTLMNNQADALEKLSDLKTNNAAVTSWVRALQARNTGDYRPLDKLDGLSQVECIEWFRALEVSANTDIAWSKLSEVQKKVPDFVRIANENDYSVGVGHELLALSLPLEFHEITSVYELAQHKKLKKENLISALNQMPEHCFSTGTTGQTSVNVIGWGLWAGFFQRQLCHAVEHDFNLLQWKWGVPDDAKEFSTKCNQMLGGLRLYPFVRRFNATDVAAYHQSVDDGFKVTVATPQLVPAYCWNHLCYDFSASEYYMPIPNPHMNEWHNHNPPPGTVYNLSPRLDHTSLTGRPDSGRLIDELHERAPYDWDLIRYILKTKYNNLPTYLQAMELFGPAVAYDNFAMETVAYSVRDQPEKYEKLMGQAAAVNPADYFALADYFSSRKEDDKAAGYIEKGTALDSDSVTAAYYADRLITYYLKHGQTEAARKEADFAGDVYSSVGLLAKAEFLEATGDYPGAFQWFANNEDRYDDSGPLVAFCLRYKAKTGSTAYDGELQKRLTKYFPDGIQQVKLADFQGAPTDGVVFQDENNLLHSAGLKAGDVIVAVYGIRVHSQLQYEYGRGISSAPELDLIVWQPGDQHYHEIKTSPPNHLFGVDIGDYQPK